MNHRSDSPIAPAGLDPSAVALVGEAPGRTGDPRRPLEGGGHVERRLRRVLDVHDEDWARIVKLNLLDAWPGPSGRKGARFPRWRAREAARAILPTLDGLAVVLLGKRVCEAVGAPCEYLTWTALDSGLRVATIPHPSGVNRWWNAEGADDRGSVTFRETLTNGMGAATRAVVFFVCPVCAAEKREWCKSLTTGKEMQGVHRTRRELEREARDLHG